MLRLSHSSRPSAKAPVLLASLRSFLRPAFGMWYAPEHSTRTGRVCFQLVKSIRALQSRSLVCYSYPGGGGGGSLKGILGRGQCQGLQTPTLFKTKTAHLATLFKIRLFTVLYFSVRLDFRRLPGPVFDPPRREDECGLIFPNSGW